MSATSRPPPPMGDVEPDSNTSLIEHTVGYTDGLLANINSLRLRSAYTDAILCCGQDEFPCHRNVLAASSTYFDAMFSSTLKESLEARVVLQDISTATLRRLLDYIYTGKIEVFIYAILICIQYFTFLVI